MIVVSDTSPVSNLIQIGHEGLLVELFGRVVIPPAVARELLLEHRPLLGRLVRNGFYLDPSVQREILRSAGEL